MPKSVKESAASPQDAATCELCGRHPVVTTVHHLVPREEGGRHLPTARLCPACHRQIHALFTNRDLVRLELTTIDRLKAAPEIASYLNWIVKQPPGSNPTVRKSARVRGKR